MKNSMFTVFSLIVSLVLLSKEAEAGIPNSCYQKRTGVSCEFYQSCLEAQFQCGPDGYPIRYGLKYCERFISLNTSRAYTGRLLSSQGLAWRNNTLNCLQDVLIPSLTMVSQISDCQKVTEFAFNSHSRCYTQPGQSICDLPKSDWLIIGTIPDALDIGTYSGLRQIKEILVTCKGSLVSKLERLQIQQARSLIAAYQTNSVEIIKPYIKEEREIRAKLELIKQIKQELNEDSI